MVQVMSGMQCYQFKHPTLEANKPPSTCTPHTPLSPRLQMLPSQHPYATCCPTFIVAEDLGRPDCHGTGAMIDQKWYTKLRLLHNKTPKSCWFVPTKNHKEMIDENKPQHVQAQQHRQATLPMEGHASWRLGKSKICFQPSVLVKIIMILNSQCQLGWV